MAVTMKKTATTQTVAIPRKKSLLLAECRTTSSLSLGLRAPNIRHAKQMVCLVVLELAVEERLLILTFTNVLGLLIFFTLIHGTVRS